MFVHYALNIFQLFVNNNNNNHINIYIIWLSVSFFFDFLYYYYDYDYVYFTRFWNIYAYVKILCYTHSHTHIFKSILRTLFQATPLGITVRPIDLFKFYDYFSFLSYILWVSSFLFFLSIFKFIHLNGFFAYFNHYILEIRTVWIVRGCKSFLVSHMTNRRTNGLADIHAI